MSTDRLFPPHTAAIFDMDGTLLDSMWVWQAVDEAFFAARGMVLPEDYARAIQAMTFRETAEFTVDRFRLPESPEQLMEEWNRLSFCEYRDHVRLKPGARDYLERLRAQGVKLGTATNLSTPVMEAVLRSNGVLHLFDALTSGDDVSRGKSFPDIYLLAARRLGVAPGGCVVFDDVLQTIQGIRAAGMTACAVRETTVQHAQNWGEMCRLFDVNIKGFEELL